MKIGDNNPRMFAETVAVDAWRTPFSAEHAEADLHIDVVFRQSGRVGGTDAPVRFRLSLRKASVHVIRDIEGAIDIKRSSVMRKDVKIAKRHKTEERKSTLAAKISALFSKRGASFEGDAQLATKCTITEKVIEADEISTMEVNHWITDRGYAFMIAPRGNVDRLDGQPWTATTKVMKIKDTEAHRKRKVQPEVHIEIHCRREDLIIEDIEFTNEKLPVWETLSRKKQIAVEQWIKEELHKRGLPCGKLSEPFTEMVLGDVSPTVER